MFSLPEEDLHYALRHCDPHEKWLHNKIENCILLILNFFAMNNHNSFHNTSSFFLKSKSKPFASELRLLGYLISLSCNWEMPLSLKLFDSMFSDFHRYVFKLKIAIIWINNELCNKLCIKNVQVRMLQGFLNMFPCSSVF